METKNEDLEKLTLEEALALIIRQKILIGQYQKSLSICSRYIKDTLPLLKEQVVLDDKEIKNFEKFSRKIDIINLEDLQKNKTLH